MTDEEVTITKGQYKHLLECEEQADKCGGCGPLAQRDRTIEKIKKLYDEALRCISTVKHNIVLADGINISRKAISDFDDYRRKLQNESWLKELQ